MTDSIRALAKSYNKLDHDLLDSILEDNIIYESQNVLDPVVGKANVMDYLRAKFDAIRVSNNLVHAEIGFLSENSQDPCIILSQGNKDNKGALILIEENNNKIARIDICTIAPHWSSAIRTDEYPK
ncbi:hypothetical protein ES711_08595 [Gelidibacter salicanalis]|uniref:Nuclear transport factor 2 family protein n=1 Tax=Gelidibacter salicanalis TaxID=291193 RepID=A0A5C7AJF1_9FLAO|nr:hypothetical protein [Gelidibacter salicanalis]TXE08551.1 hypothetical protein ES711_08595 [Gelidibacter salicanalis]